MRQGVRQTEIDIRYMNFLDALRAVRDAARPLGFSKRLSRSIKPVPSVIEDRSPSQTMQQAEDAIRRAILKKGKQPTQKTLRPRR
jgi:hypothetical protein